MKTYKFKLEKQMDSYNLRSPGRITLDKKQNIPMKSFDVKTTPSKSLKVIKTAVISQNKQ